MNKREHQYYKAYKKYKRKYTQLHQHVAYDNNRSRTQFGGGIEDQAFPELKVYVSPSDIHGVGLRALRDISAGETVFRYKMQPAIQLNLKKSEYDYLYHYYGDWQKPEITPDGRYLYNMPVDSRETFPIYCFLNHSENPNVVFKGDSNAGYYQAPKLISKGDEILLDYTHNDYNQIPSNKDPTFPSKNKFILSH